MLRTRCAFLYYIILWVFILDTAEKDNSTIILVTFKTILSAGSIENVVMKLILKS